MGLDLKCRTQKNFISLSPQSHAGYTKNSEKAKNGGWFVGYTSALLGYRFGGVKCYLID